MKQDFKETPKLAEHGKAATREFALAKNIHDAIGPKVREFNDLKRDTREKMKTKRDQHLARAGEELKAARELMRVDGLGSFDAWVKSGAVLGMKGKAISKAQVYNLIEGNAKSSPNTPKTRETSTRIDEGGRLTPDDGEFVAAPWSGIPKAKQPPVVIPVWERPHVKNYLADWHGFADDERAYMLPILNTPMQKFG